MDIRPILVGYDASPDARAALRWALDEGDRTSTPVLLAHAFDWYVDPMWLASGAGGWSDTEARADISAMLASAVEDAETTHPGVDVTARILDGPAQVCLRDLSADAALIVVGGRGTGGFAELLIGSTAVSVSAHAHCPVVVVRAGTAEATGDVVVGVDGSPCSLVALEFAFERAATYQTTLRVIQTWTPPSTRFVPQGLSLLTISRNIARTIHGDLDDMVADWRQKYPQVPTSTHVHTGSAAAQLVAASDHARLVVVGSRGRGSISGTFLGSVGQELIHHSHCPVAIVREVAQSAAG
ncbi:universal stress protein [Asanoa sp. NPDC049573]|uniref:universal stress protein n=1 Tax=Asanoa sp. NPDC049573 TaxID=3155396 RepID=UPI003423398F